MAPEHIVANTARVVPILEPTSNEIASRRALRAKLVELIDGVNALEGAGQSAQLDVTTAPCGEAGGLARGQVVSTHAGQFYLADNTNQLLASVVGIVVQGAQATLPTSAQCDGAVTLTTQEWDAVTGQSGGLTPGARYYLGTGGQLTTTPPSAQGTFSVAVGRAVDAGTLVLRIQPYVYL